MIIIYINIATVQRQLYHAGRDFTSPQYGEDFYRQAPLPQVYFFNSK